jgi:hypothetical protein
MCVCVCVWFCSNNMGAVVNTALVPQVCRECRHACTGTKLVVCIVSPPQESKFTSMF